MDDLVTWLLAQLDEDERVARLWPEREWRAVGDEVVSPEDLVVAESGAAEHIARWDPARVLAEVDARRRILDAHFPVDPCDAHDAMSETIACDTLRLLALPLADRPGYDESWRP